MSRQVPNRPDCYYVQPLLQMVKLYRRGGWTNIPYVFHWHTILYTYRNRYGPEFQFRYNPRFPRAWVTEGKHRGKRGYQLQVRYIYPKDRQT